MSLRLTLITLLCLSFNSSAFSQKLINGFSRELAINQLPAPFSIKSFDVTGDSVAELFVSSGTRLLIFDGKTFNLIFQDTAAPGTANLSSADVNNDGQTDLVSTAGDSGVVVWFGPNFQPKSCLVAKRGFNTFAVKNKGDGQVEFIFGFESIYFQPILCLNYTDSAIYTDGYVLKYVDTTLMIADSIHLAGSPIFMETKSVSATGLQGIAFIAMDDYYRPCMPSGFSRQILMGYYDTALASVGSFGFSKFPDAPCPRPPVIVARAIGSLDADSGAEFVALTTQPNSICGIPSNWDFRAYDMLTGTLQWRRTDSLGIFSLFTLDLNDDGIEELLSYEIENSMPGLAEYKTSDGATLGFSEIPFIPTTLLTGIFGAPSEPKLLLAHSDSVVVYGFNVATGVDEIPGKTNLPRNPELFPPMPNPFNAQSTIRFTLPKSGEMTLQIFDVLGRQVQTLFSGFQKAGRHQITWNAADRQGIPLASGIYFAVLKTGDIAVSQKLVLVK